MSRKKFLKEGEVICDNCHGDTPQYGDSITVCKKCWGSGKLDWIDVCVGKKIPDELFILPKIRKMYPRLLTKDIISVQPMTGIKL